MIVKQFSRVKITVTGLARRCQ